MVFFTGITNNSYFSSQLEDPVPEIHGIFVSQQLLSFFQNIWIQWQMRRIVSTLKLIFGFFTGITNNSYSILSFLRNLKILCPRSMARGWNDVGASEAIEAASVRLKACANLVGGLVSWPQMSVFYRIFFKKGVR